MTEVLKPCPFCGCTDIDPTGWTGMDKDRNRIFGPSCTACGATAESIDDWQRRTYTADWSDLERRMLALLDQRLPPVRCIVCGQFSPTPGCACDSPATGRLKADRFTPGQRLLRAAQEATEIAGAWAWTYEELTHSGHAWEQRLSFTRPTPGPRYRNIRAIPEPGVLAPVPEPDEAWPETSENDDIVDEEWDECTCGPCPVHRPAEAFAAVRETIEGMIMPEGMPPKEWWETDATTGKVALKVLGWLEAIGAAPPLILNTTDAFEFTWVIDGVKWYHSFETDQENGPHFIFRHALPAGASA